MKLVAIFFASVLALQANAAAVKSTIHIRWKYQNLPPVMEIYEYDTSKKARLWEMKSVKGLNEAPVLKKIANSDFQLEARKAKRFVLVFQNPDDKPYYFFAAPHVAHPAEHSLGFKFKCLCTNHAYQVGPKEFWYRVVDFKLYPDFEGQELTVEHTLIGISEERMKSFQKSDESSDG